MRCPRCKIELASREEGAGGWLTIHVCTRCEGMCLGAGALDALDHSVWTSAESLPTTPAAEPSIGTAGYRDPAVVHGEGVESPYIDCPRCELDVPMRMARLVYDQDASIAMDRCDRCRGMWLDGGVIESIRALVGSIDSNIVAEMSWKPGASDSNAAGLPTPKKS